MFAGIASFLWGTRAGAEPAPPVHVDDPVSAIPSPKLFTEEDVISFPRLSPEPQLSLSSLSDEEADWVFVNGNADGSGSEKESETMDIVSPFSNEVIQDRRRREPHRRPNAQAPITRSTARGLHSSALLTQSDLTAQVVMRPQQKAERRQRELRLKHKQLERSNLAQEVNSSSNRPNKRKNRLAPNVISRAVNNRKC